jgi:hypothetical protein
LTQGRHPLVEAPSRPRHAAGENEGELVGVDVAAGQDEAEAFALHGLALLHQGSDSRQHDPPEFRTASGDLGLARDNLLRLPQLSEACKQ